MNFPHLFATYETLQRAVKQFPLLPWENSAPTALILDMSDPDLEDDMLAG
jgi:hypothetical protein